MIAIEKMRGDMFVLQSLYMWEIKFHQFDENTFYELRAGNGTMSVSIATCSDGILLEQFMRYIGLRINEPVNIRDVFVEFMKQHPSGDLELKME